MAEYQNRENAKKHREEVERQNALDTAEKIQGKTVKILAKAGTGGRLFGSVTSKEIAEAASKEFGVSIDKKKVSLESDIKAFGTYTVEVKLLAGVTAKLYAMVAEE